MTAGATDWVWANSRAANGSLLVLLVIARELDANGDCVMSTAELAGRSRLSERAVRSAVTDLTAHGELEVLSGGCGRGNRHAYGLPGNPADSATFESETRQNLPPSNPAESATFETPSSAKPQVRPNPADSATFETSDESSSTGPSVVTKPSSERLDVNRLCALLADRIEANGSKRPNITKRWRDAARRMIDIDGRTEEQVTRAIDWCQKDEFWSANILSMPKLREKYDQLRMKATQEQRRRSQPGRSNPDDDYAAALGRIHARKETQNGTGRNGDNRPAGQVSIPSAAD